MERYCQLLVEEDGHVCLPYKEWNEAAVVRECERPAAMWLDFAGDLRVYVCAEHFDRIQKS